MSPRSYAHKTVQGTHETTYGRRLLYAEANSLARAIKHVRATATSEIGRVGVQYCWVDLDRRWELAHSRARAQRCLEKYTDNAANYLEATLRNTNWTSFHSYHRESWMVTIAWALEKSPAGVQWLSDRPSQSLRLSVEAEVKYLRGRNLTRFELQYHNGYLLGLAESIELENALRQRQTVPTKTVVFELHPWTTVNMFWFFFNDMGVMKGANFSIVRGDSQHMDELGLEWSMVYGYNDENNEYWNQYGVFYSQISPFGSGDVLYVPCPEPLVASYRGFVSTLNDKVWPDEAKKATLLNAPSVEWTPRPPRFRIGDNLTYFGGNLLCLDNPPSPYPQSPYAFQDGCGQTKPFTMPASSQGVLFSLAQSTHPDLTQICALRNQESGDTCVSTLHLLLALRNSILDERQLNDLAKVAAALASQLPPIQFYQYAHNASANEWLLLQQPLLTPANPSWSFFGWLAIHDWIVGKREVIRIEGDVTTVVIMSDINPIALQPLSSQIDGAQSGPQTIYFLVVYTTAFSVVLGGVVLVYAAKCRFSFRTRNLFVFNRVAGCVWVGRPLLLLRGLTAVLVLSSTTTSVALEGGYTKLVGSRRSFWEVLLVAGEATWVSYVISDVLLIATSEKAKLGGAIGAGLTWVVTVVLELTSPISISLVIDQECTAVNTKRGLDCTAGVLFTGSWVRILVLLAVQVGPVLLTLCSCVVHGLKRKQREKAPLLWHGSAETYLVNDLGHEGFRWQLDDVACVLTGLIPFSIRGRDYTFDLKLWTLIEDTSGCQQSDGTMAFRNPSFKATSSRNFNADLIPSLGESSAGSSLLRHRLVVVCGLVYLALSALGSVSYFALSTVNFANDFYWATFNMTGHHVVIAQWMHLHTTLDTKLGTFGLDEARWTSLAQNYSNPNIATTSPKLLASIRQTRVSLTTAIAGLRRSDPCLVPWISAQYCWVDFKRQWPMANSKARQLRCLADVSNGAVYLEAVLRNVDWTAFAQCWGTSFDVAIANDVKLTLEGRQWLETMQTSGQQVVDAEVAAWTRAGVDEYVVQWQNYKRIGLINTYMIENALGVQYPVTLSRVNGSLYLKSQTSFKLYWGWASDLWAVSANHTFLGGKSLISTSANYAFANRTMLSVLLQNQTLYAPLYEAFQVVQGVLGPYGSIDTKIIPCPQQARTLMATGVHLVRHALTKHPTSATTYVNTTTEQIEHAPTVFKQLVRHWSFGGSLLCGESGGGNINSQMLQFTVREESCGNMQIASMRVGQDGLLTSAMVMRFDQANGTVLDRMCWHAANAPRCQNVYSRQISSFVRDFIDPVDIQAMQPLVAEAVSIVRATNISLVQYVRLLGANSRMRLASAALMDPNDPTFDFWSWLYVFDWAMGNREVVTFQGDVGVVTIITDASWFSLQPVQPQEMPTTFATYARSGVQYVTGVMLGVAGCICICIVTSRGRIEGYNMFELNRVAGIVWVGRPLLFLRGLTALCLLSTSTLELVRSGALHASFDVPQLPWYTTMFGAGEATWLVYILNDVLMVWTQEYTQMYAPYSSSLVWVTASILTVVAPVKHRVTFDPACTFDQVDFQLVCQTAVVAIGDVQRLYWLLAIIGICNVVSYVGARLTQKSVGQLAKQSNSSLLLSSGAKYLFDKTNWMHCDVYHMDTASALLNGLLATRWGQTTYVMDIKLWRWFSISKRDSVPTRMSYAVPLTD